MLRFFSMTLAAGTMFVGTAVSTLAADMAAPAEATYQAPNWTGFYVGVHGGMASGNMGYDVLPFFPGDELLSFDFSRQESAYGIHAGFDYQFGNRWVAGLEIDYSPQTLTYTPFDNGLRFTLVEAKSDFAATGRLGYLVTPETLFYGRLGYASLKLEAAEGADGMAEKSTGAIKAGFGSETFVAENVTARIEANYVDGTSELVTADFYSFDPKYLMVIAGLSFRFGANNGSGRSVENTSGMQFSGFYAGGFGALDFGKSILAVVGDDQATVGPHGGDAVGFGGFVGYDFLLGDSYVLGAEAEAAYVDVKFHDPFMNQGIGDATTLFGTIKATYALSARVGYVTSPSTLVYLKGGFAGIVMDPNREFFGTEVELKKTLSAYQVGAGIESALTNNISMRVEGMYIEATDSIVVDHSQIGQLEIKPSLLTGRIGLAYRF